MGVLLLTPRLPACLSAPLAPPGGIQHLPAAPLGLPGAAVAARRRAGRDDRVPRGGRRGRGRQPAGGGTEAEREVTGCSRRRTRARVLLRDPCCPIIALQSFVDWARTNRRQSGRQQQASCHAQQQRQQRRRLRGGPCRGRARRWRRRWGRAAGLRGAGAAAAAWGRRRGGWRLRRTCSLLRLWRRRRDLGGRCIRCSCRWRLCRLWRLRRLGRWRALGPCRRRCRRRWWRAGGGCGGLCDALPGRLGLANCRRQAPQPSRCCRTAAMRRARRKRSMPMQQRQLGRHPIPLTPRDQACLPCPSRAGLRTSVLCRLVGKALPAAEARPAGLRRQLQQARRRGGGAGGAAVGGVVLAVPAPLTGGLAAAGCTAGGRRAGRCVKGVAGGCTPPQSPPERVPHTAAHPSAAHTRLHAPMWGCAVQLRVCVRSGSPPT